MTGLLEDPQGQYQLYLSGQLQKNEDNGDQSDGDDNEEEETSKNNIWRKMINRNIKGNKNKQKYECDKNRIVPVSFEKFVTKTFRCVREELIICLTGLYTHMPTSLVPLDTLEHMIKVVNLLDHWLVKEAINVEESGRMTISQTVILHRIRLECFQAMHYLRMNFSVPQFTQYLVIRKMPCWTILLVTDDDEEVADPLEMRIADSAIEYHIVDCINQKKNKKANDPEKAKSLNRCYGILQSVIEEMDSIENLVVDLQKKKKVPLVHDQVGTTNFTASVAARSETLVGSDGVLIEIMENLDGGQPYFQVIPIVGMGGIGKTFLAKTIYTKPLIKERFDICAWATISQHYDTKQILCELLFQATNTNKEQQSVDELGLELHKYLFGRRFLIVMDDMWSIDSWDLIQRFFPNNYNGSRVLVTTRLSQLSSQLTTDYSLNMSFLDKASSWDLFSKTVFGEKSSCPPELKEIGVKIVDNCRGLPLSISVVGGLLKTMDGTRASWESIRDNFTSVVNMRNDKHCLRLLKLSYNHLCLKPCFLYMGVYEEDEEICVSTLIVQWVSEGFLKSTKGEALEITGRGFLEDLVGRNLILIDNLGSTGSIKFCKIHDLVRDMCLKEGQKEGFYHVMGKSNHPSPQGTNAQRRVIILNNTLKENNIRGDLRFMSHTRSIICEDGSRVPLCKNLVLLRTLQVHDKFSFTYDEMKTGLNSVVSRNVNLRHLAIAASWIPPFLPSISHLWNLRTLVVSYSFDLDPILVVDFWEMTQLRHMNFIGNSACLPDPPSCDGRDGVAVVIMENLNTLKGIMDFKFRKGVVKRIPNIKNLNMMYIHYHDDGDDDVYFLGNMKYLCGLESLSVNFSLASIPFTHLQKITYPHSLKKLCLWVAREHEWNDMLEKIGSLPLLEKLRLTYGCFEKGKWEIGQGQFPCLKYLKVSDCRGLENLSAVEEDSYILPRLEHLHLDTLEELKKIPFELGNIDTLKSIILDRCGEGAVESAKEMFDEQVDLQGGEDQLSFHVEVIVRKEHQHLMSLACSNFYVSVLSF